MIDYTLLKAEKIPEAPESEDITKNSRPRWVTCVAFAAAALTVITSAITIGMIMGYTYCYIEHRSGLRPGNFTEQANLHILRMSPNESSDLASNRTINGALMSSVIISRILTLGEALVEEEMPYFPWVNEEMPSIV